VGFTLQMRMRLEVATAVTASDHRWLRPTRFAAPRPLSFGNEFPQELSAARAVGTVPWNLMSRLASNPLQPLTSFLSRPGRRSSFPTTPDSLRQSRFDGPKALDDLLAPAMSSRTPRTVENAHPSPVPEDTRGFLTL
jgi:hypothetical protein